MKYGTIEYGTILALEIIKTDIALFCSCGAPLKSGGACIRIKAADTSEDALEVFAEKAELICAFCGKKADEVLPVIFSSYSEAVLRAASLQKAIKKGEYNIITADLAAMNYEEKGH